VTLVDVEKLLEGFHDDRKKWAKFHGVDDVPPGVPVLANQETIELLAGGDFVTGVSPYNPKDRTLFWHPVVIRQDFEIGQFRFVPIYQDNGKIIFTGGPYDVSRVMTLERFPKEASVLSGKWRHIFDLYVKESDLGAIFLEYKYRETVIGGDGLVEIGHQ